MFKKGQKVKQIQAAPIEGVVEGFSVNQDTGESLVRISYGDGHNRYFKSEELEAV